MQSSVLNQSHMKYLSCIVCLELAKKAVNCSSCNNILCSSCVDSLKNKECPLCRVENPVYLPNIVIQRMINDTPMQCPDQCGSEILFGNLDQHKLVCQFRKFDCPQIDCQFKSGMKQEFLEHIFNNHAQKLLESFLNAKQGNEQQSVQLQQQIEQQKQQILQLQQQLHLSQQQQQRQHQQQPNQFSVYNFEPRRNIKGRTAQIGEFGKYYCGGRLEERCMCCDGNCGPTNGCNCKGCMILDIQARNLPKGFLINRVGIISQFKNGMFECGRKFASHQRSGSLFGFISNYTQCKNGQSCQECISLTQQSQSIYANIF